jgi:cysteinyl-tRNA synthetase
VLGDDFNTPSALALLHDWTSQQRLELVKPCLELFGLGSLTETATAPAELIELARSRQHARGGKDFTEADRLRAEIESRGWEVRDVADGFQLVPRQ